MTGPLWPGFHGFYSSDTVAPAWAGAESGAGVAPMWQAMAALV